MWNKSHSLLIILSVIFFRYHQFRFGLRTKGKKMDKKRIRGIDLEFEIDFKERCGMSIGDIPNILDFSVDRQLCECTNTEDNPKVQKDIDQKEELYIALKKGLEDIENGRIRPLKEAIDDIKTRRGYFSKEILKELTDEGYSGSELLDIFRIRQAKVRPAVEAILEEAKNAAKEKGEYFTKEEVFGAESRGIIK